MKPAKPTSLFSAALRVVAALGLTVLLLVFLAALRLQYRKDPPLVSLRAMDTASPVSTAAPPPPPAELTPTPPPDMPELPDLSLEIDIDIPALPSRPQPKLNQSLPSASFASNSPVGRQSMTFQASELDVQPRLVNRPPVTFPSTLASRGITEGTVVLEVVINSAGSVRVRRVLETSHTELADMGRSFASRARFTPPKKDGRPVAAVFRWPLVLKL